jgi:hypothetical protein
MHINRNTTRHISLSANCTKVLVTAKKIGLQNSKKVINPTKWKKEIKYRKYKCGIKSSRPSGFYKLKR